VTGTFVGQHCGNGQIDPGEACDDGNLENSDCCDSTCQFEPSGSPCTDNPCADACDGAGTCVHQNRPDGATCDDSNACTMGDTCQNGSCQGGPAVQCAACDTCSPAVGCEPQPDGTTCDDGDACTSNDTCLSGGCSGTPVTCAPCLACISSSGCVPTIDVGCKHAGRSSIRLSKSPTERLVWQWLRGDLTSPQELGDPQSSTDYALCVYDGTVDQHGNPGLLLQALAPAGASWLPTASGFAYTSTDQLPNGISHIRLKPGQATKAKVLVNASGSNLDLPPLQSVVLPLTVQLKAAGGLACWESSYEAARNQDDRLLNAHAP